MTEEGTTPASELALGLVVSLSSLDIDDLVRLTLQKPDITRVFSAALHTLAVSKVASLIPTSSPDPDQDVAALAMVQVIMRLIERGDPSLARAFLPTHGSLIDFCVVSHGLASQQAKNILDRLIDSTAVESILRSLLSRLEDSASLESESAGVSVCTASSLLLAFIASCPSRPLLGLENVLASCLRMCFDLYDWKAVSHGQGREANHGLSEQDAHLHWLAAKVNLMQICSVLLQTLRPLPLDPIASELERSASLLRDTDYEHLTRSTIWIDMSTTDIWPSIIQTLSTTGLPASSMNALASINQSASRTPSFTGAGWSALQTLAGPQVSSSKSDQQSVSEEILATVDSILPHYGLTRLKTILSRDSFRGQDVETIIQRLLEGDEGGDSSQVAVSAAPEPEYRPPVQPPPPASRIKSRANLFGDSAIGAPPLVQLKQRTSKVEDLPPELKAAILARAEAADDDSDADEEWNPFAEPQRTVGVEDELDLDFEGRERGVFTSHDSDDHDTEDEEDPSRARERTLIRHYIQSGSTAFSADQGIRKSADRTALKGATGWSDDLIESWGIMFERNPMKDRLLAAATDAELDRNLGSSRGQLPDDDSDDDHDRPRWGADRGRGGRILGARGGSRGQGGRGGAPNATRGKGTGHSGTDRAAKLKEKQGNKARQRGHDKKMSRVNP